MTQKKSIYKQPLPEKNSLNQKETEGNCTFLLFPIHYICIIITYNVKAATQRGQAACRAPCAYLDR